MYLIEDLNLLQVTLKSIEVRNSNEVQVKFQKII